jgi:uncharacterized protein YcbK (DUF882 family)
LIIADAVHRLQNILEKIRFFAGGKSLEIESGCRCPKHNAAVGGVAGSAHLTGEAADIRCAFSQKRFALVKAALQCGIDRVGIATTFVHVDISTDNPQDEMWLYKGD